MPLVVRKHPTEVLPPNSEYLLSGAHPLHLLSRASVLIVFITSTVADGLYFGVPIIEILSLARDPKRLIPSERTWARQVGVVDSPRSYASLRTSLQGVVKRPGLSHRGPSERYRSLILPPDNDGIANRILSAIEAK